MSTFCTYMYFVEYFQTIIFFLKFILKQVVLLDDASRSHFNISSITVGPKKNQKAQKIGENCQEWLHPQFDTAQANMEKVYRVKVRAEQGNYD